MDYNFEDEQDLPLDGLTLLLADDEYRLRQIVVLMAEELGARVIAVDNCEDVIDVYEERMGEIDLVMLDLKMREMGGEAAFKKIMEINPDARVILSSGIRPSESLIEELHRLNGDFIEKPFDMDQLGETLSTVAGR